MLRKQQASVNGEPIYLDSTDSGVLYLTCLAKKQRSKYCIALGPSDTHQLVSYYCMLLLFPTMIPDV